MDLPSDLIDLLAAFEAAGVEFLVVGGQALALHGHDLMKGVPGGDFQTAWSGRKKFVIQGVAVPVVSKRELIRLKRASGRPQDLLDADLLEEASADEEG